MANTHPKQLATYGTAVTASGTAVNFTGIPAWVRKITVGIVGISTNGTTKLQVRIGDSGGIETSSYVGSTGGADGVGSIVDLSSGFDFASSMVAAKAYSGQMILTLIDSPNNTWVATAVGATSGIAFFSGGYKSLDTALTQLQLTAGGTDTFDAGTVNIRYEG